MFYDDEKTGDKNTNPGHQFEVGERLVAAAKAVCVRRDGHEGEISWEDVVEVLGEDETHGVLVRVIECRAPRPLGSALTGEAVFVTRNALTRGFNSPTRVASAMDRILQGIENQDSTENRGFHEGS